MRAPQRDIQLSTGETASLARLYEDRKLVLVFLRHLGCVFCRQHVAQLRVHSALNIAFVAMAGPEETEAFRQKMRSPHRFICDADRELYRDFGLGRGEGKQIYSPKVFARGFGATLRGHMVGLPIGDPWQMPGVFLIEPDGEISWEYRSVDASDNPNPGEVVRRLS